MVEGSNVIRSGDIVKSVLPSTSQPLMTPQSPMSVGLGDLKGFMEMFREGLQTIKEIQKMRIDSQKILSPAQPQTDGFTGQAPNLPPTQPSTNNPPQPISPIPEEIIYKEMELDKEKLKTFLKSLIVEEGEKLPDELKKKKLSEITGSNFDKLSVNIKKFGMNITADGDQILDVICDQLIKILPSLKKEDKK